MQYLSLKFPYFLLCTVLSKLPGNVGKVFETKKLFLLKSLKFKTAKIAFDRAIAALGPASIAIDLGANVGHFTEILANAAGKVHAFEPDPWTFQQLKNRVDHLGNVTLHEAAAGASEGTAGLRRVAGFGENPGRRSQGSTLQAADDLFYALESDKISVPVIDFIAFLKQLDADVDIIKIDIEGSEIDLLNALLDSEVRHRVKKIFCETHEAQMPQLRTATRTLRARVASISEPRINLDWV